MSDGLIRDLAVIQRRSKRRENEDLRFRTFLKVHTNMKDRKLDQTVREITDYIWSQIDCKTCANCCKTLKVEVNDEDISRLAARLELTAEQFTEQYVVEPLQGMRTLRSQPCVFLGEDNRCTVYEDRPEDCRGYPYLHREGFRQRTFLMIDNTAVCPIVFNVWDELKDTMRFCR